MTAVRVSLAPAIALALMLGLAPALAQDEAEPEAPETGESVDEAGAEGADGPQWRHATGLVGEPKYPSDFEHFDYVNANAPKGGMARLSETGTFDSMNPILPRGVPATGLGLIYESLMTSSLDETDNAVMYGLLAESMRFPDDYSWVTYRLNPDARWHDGEPVTPEDVVWSFEKITELNPSQRFYYQHVESVEITGEREITFTFDETGNRELPHIVGQLLVMPQHWWEGERADGTPRSIEAGTLERPLGSGPYRVGEVRPGRSVTYERVEDYWGADLAVNVGQYNFDQVRYEYFRDRTVQFEAFKADQFDYWWENEARRWEVGYDFPAVRDGRVVREAIELDRDSGIMIGFIPNLRREPFDDWRVRRALNHAFNFEELNRSLFYGQYERINSFFYGLDALSWSGLPEGRELEILESVRGEVPERVFTEEYANPENGSSQAVRENLREAVGLLQDAGYRLQGNRMVDEDGTPLSFELLLNGPTIERVAIPYAQALERIGIEMTIRSVDSNQFVNRVRSRDYDMIYTGWGQSNSPGNEQADYWGSAAADLESSRNYAGITDPAVDALIRRIVFAADREDLEAATRALDRVLIQNQYVIPSYSSMVDRIAYWDRFGHPDPLPRFAIGFPQVWWYEEARVEETGEAPEQPDEAFEETFEGPVEEDAEGTDE